MSKSFSSGKSTPAICPICGHHCGERPIKEVFCLFFKLDTHRSSMSGSVRNSSLTKLVKADWNLKMKKQNKITCCRDWPTRTDERLKSGWNYWANILSVTDICAHYFGQYSQIFQCMHRVDIMCKVPTVALILVTNSADLRLWTEFYLLKLMDLMVNTKQNMMKIRSLSNCW